MRCLIPFFLIIISTQAQSGSIDGQVVNSVTGAPIRDAAVSLLGPLSQRALLPGRGSPTPEERSSAGPQQALSDDQGGFRFSKLAPGNYALRANRAGYEAVMVGRKGVGQELMPIGEGQQVKDIVIKLPPTAVVTGKVLDEKGAPVQNAQVAAVILPNAPAGLQVSPSSRRVALTDDRGIYRLPGLIADTYGLWVLPPQALGQPEGQSATAYPPTFFPDTSERAALGTFTLTPGETRTIDFRLRKIPMVRIKGRVLGPNGLSRGPGRVQLDAQSPSSLNRLEAVPTAIDGSFEIWAPPGAYHLMTVLPAAANTEAMIGSLPVDLRANMDAVTVTLVPPRQIRGSIKLEGKAVVDLHAVRPQLLPNEAPSYPLSTLKEDLSFVFEGVPAMRRTVRLNLLPPNCYVKSMQYGGKEVPATGLLPAADAVLSVVVSTAGAAKVEGTVRDASGKPAAYSTITLLPLDAVAMSALTGYADRDGKFTFPAVRPGPYKVWAWETNGAAIMLQSEGLDALKPIDGRSVTVRPNAGGRAAIDLIVVTADERRKAFSPK